MHQLPINRETRWRLRSVMIVHVLTTAWVSTSALAADKPIRSDKPYAVTFPTQQAKFVRVVISATSGGGAGCIDELEVYGRDEKRNLALAKHGAKASASSCISGYPIHAIDHLNDGQYGNDHSWVAGGTGPTWAQIEFHRTQPVSRVVLSRDRLREYDDRVPTQFAVQLSVDGQSWGTVKEIQTKALPVKLLPKRSN